MEPVAGEGKPGQSDRTLGRPADLLPLDCQCTAVRRSCQFTVFKNIRLCDPAVTTQSLRLENLDDCHTGAAARWRYIKGVRAGIERQHHRCSPVGSRRIRSSAPTSARSSCRRFAPATSWWWTTSKFGRGVNCRRLRRDPPTGRFSRFGRGSLLLPALHS